MNPKDLRTLLAEIRSSQSESDTFKDEANQSLLAVGAKPIDVEDLNLFKIRGEKWEKEKRQIHWY